MKYIFIHGLGQNASSWNETLSYREQTMETHCLELSEMIRNQEVTYANLYREFVKYCNSMTEPINLCGLSLGAILALNYTIDHPERVQSLVLIGGQYKMPKGLLKFQNIIFRVMPNGVFQKMGFSKRDFIELTHSMMELDFSEALKNISCDTLIVCGEKDQANKKAALNLAAAIPKADLQMVKGAGHEVNVEAPRELGEILKAIKVGGGKMRSFSV